MFDDLLARLTEAGIRFVSIHLRSEKEIRAYLTKKLKQYRSENLTLVEKAFDRLRELGYVDDNAYARAFIASRNAHNQKGDRLLTLEMKAKGIAPDVITSLLEEVHTKNGETEFVRAEKLIEKKKNTFKLHGLERKKKLFSYLSRRGFSSDTIHRIIDGRDEKD